MGRRPGPEVNEERCTSKPMNRPKGNPHPSGRGGGQTPEQHRGKGYAAKLVEAAVEDAEKRNLKIVPICSYSVHYFIRNKEKRHLLDEPYTSMSEEELQNYYKERLNAEKSKH